VKEQLRKLVEDLATLVLPSRDDNDESGVILLE
jgi:hypothetical protein